MRITKILCVLIILIPLVCSLESMADYHMESDTIQIITTILPLTEFASQICGSQGEVFQLIPSGAEAHTWQPRPSDIIRLSKADIFVFIGPSMEPWIQDVLRSVNNPGLKVVEAGKGLLEPAEEEHSEEHDHEGIDPHIWLDFSKDQVIVDRISEALSQVAPDSSGEFTANAEACKQQLLVLDQQYAETLRQCSQRTFIFGGHAAFGHLAERYNLNQIALYGLSPDAQPTPRQLKEVIDLARKHEIQAIFFEELVSDDLARVIAKEVGVKTLVLNPGANMTREQKKMKLTFFDIMRKNLENLKNGLGCQ